MKRSSGLLFVTCLLVAGGIFWYRLRAQLPALIPLEVFFNSTERSTIGISPDGTKLAYIAQYDGVANIWVEDLATGKAEPVTFDQHRGIRNYFWLYDNKSIGYSQDKDGDENTNLYVVDLATKEVRAVTPYPDCKVHLLRLSWRHPEKVIVEINKEDKSLFDLYELNIETGQLILLHKNAGEVGEWIINSALELVGIERFDDQGGKSLLLKDPATNKFTRKIVEWGIDEFYSSHLLEATSTNKLLLADARHSDTTQLVEIDLSIEGKETILYQNQRYDISKSLLHPLTEEVVGVGIQDDTFHYAPLNAAFALDVQVLSNLLSGKEWSIANTSLDFNKWVIVASSSNQPASYYLYDRVQKKIRLLQDTQPDLVKFSMLPKELIRFNARDGLAIEGYLTKPAFGCAPYPTVLMVHGGPWRRDSSVFDPEVQLLSNRGYAVLQVNYRGSTGYGKKHLMASAKEWGGNVQNDLTDAAHWAIEKNITDPQRIAIYGASFGGYSVLCGIAFMPHLYAAAIDMFGVSNLLSFRQSEPAYWKIMEPWRSRLIGKLPQDEKLLQQQSPLLSADKIRTAILIAQGANDPRVVKAESDQIVNALKEHGVPFEYVVYKDEGHGFVRPVNRLDFYARLEKFLAKYLGGRSE